MPQIKTTQEFQSLFDIDANVNRLVRNIELLNYINPLNITAEKKKFFSAKYNYEPSFRYPKIKFNGYKLHRLFFRNASMCNGRAASCWPSALFAAAR